MANLDEIYRRMEQERSQRAEQERRAAEQAEIRRREFVLAEQRLYESIIITAGAGASAGGGGGKGNAIPAYFTIQVTPQLDGDGLSFYIESPSAVTYDWGDGTIDDTGEHGYSTAGSYQIKISPINITGFQMASMSDGIYSGPKFSEFRYLTELVGLWIVENASTIEDGALDNCKKLEILAFKFGGPTQLKKSIFNNLISLTDFFILYGNIITSFESGVFEGTNIEALYFYNTPFTNTTLVDNFLIDLNNSNLPNLTDISLYTHRTINSDVAVSGLTEKGVTVDVIRDESPLLITVSGNTDFWFNTTLSYSVENPDPMHVDWGDGSSDDYSNDSKKKGGWAYFPSHYYETPGEYTITMALPIDNSIYFYIEGTYITNITFPPLTSLETLYMDYLQIDTVDFSHLTGLKYLYLNSSQFTSIPDLHDLTGLLQLSLNSNPLTGTLSFSGLTSLVYLNLSECNLNTLVGSDFSDLISLTNLDLGYNNLTSLPDDIFSTMTHLVTLTLNNNNLTTLQAGLFSGLTSLIDLELSYNSISNIDVTTFRGLTSLSNIGLDSNQLSGLTAGVFSGLTNLWYNLNLSNNYISSLPDGLFSDLNSLGPLYLNDNRLNNLQDGVFNGLNSLTTLYLYNNRINGITTGTFSGLTSLQDLQLSSNLLQELPHLEGMPNLLNLRLNYNHLTEINSGTFTGITSLHYLDLSNNILTASGLTDGSFYGLNGSFNIYLTSNDLHGIDVMAFQGVQDVCSEYLDYCSLTSTDVDNLIIRFNNIGKNSCTINLLNNSSRTSASNVAFTHLTTTNHCNVYVTGP